MVISKRTLELYETYLAHVERARQAGEMTLWMDKDVTFIRALCIALRQARGWHDMPPADGL